MRLDSQVDHELKITIGHREKFLCKPGLVNRKMAVQITKILNEGDTENE